MFGGELAVGSCSRERMSCGFDRELELCERSVGRVNDVVV